MNHIFKLVTSVQNIIQAYLFTIIFNETLLHTNLVLIIISKSIKNDKFCIILRQTPKTIGFLSIKFLLNKNDIFTLKQKKYGNITIGLILYTGTFNINLAVDRIGIRNF